MKKGVIFLLVVVLLINGIVAQEYVPGEVIVKYKEGVVGWGNKVVVDSEIVVYDQVEEPIEEEKIVEGVELYNLRFEEGVDVLEVIEEYESIEEVEYAEPNFLFVSDVIPNDSSYDNLNWPENINVEEAWNLSVGNKEIVIAILDTGVDWNHPDLAANIIVGADGCNASLDLDGNGYFGDCRGYDFTDINVTSYVNAGYTLVDGEDYNLTDNDPMDFDGHGTHVTGIAAGVGDNGVGVVGSCWNCSIMPVRSGFRIITSSGNSIGSLEVDDVTSAIYYAADNNATIISMSFGGGDSSTIRDAIEYAYSKGSIMLASSGNSGSNSKQYPCAYEEVVCVGSTNSDNSPASYSNYGDWVDLVSPGTSILSTGFDDTYVSLSGTSMSTPMIAGVVGLVRSLFELNQSEIVDVFNGNGIEVNYSGTLINRTDVYSSLLDLDDIAPEINLVNPIDDHVNLTLNHTFECEVNDWQLANNKLMIWDGTGDLFYNSSEAVSGIVNISRFDVTLENDTYSWNCLGEDANRNLAYASSNFSISTLGTRLTLDNPQDNSYVNSNPNLFGCSVHVNNGNDISNLSYRLFNESGLVYSDAEVLSGNSNSSEFSYDFVDEGSYHWNCESRDNLNVLTLSDNRSIYYDVTNPVVNLLDPKNGNSYESDSQQVDFSYNASEVASCDLIVDDDLKSSINGQANGTFSESFSPGDYSWFVNCTDLAGNFDRSELRSFTVEEPSDGSGGGGGSGSGGGSGGGSGSGGSSGGGSGGGGSEGGSGGGSGGGGGSGSGGSSGGGSGGGGGSSGSGGSGGGSGGEGDSGGSGRGNSGGDEEPNIEDNFQTDENQNPQGGITGFAVEQETLNLSKLQKYKNRVNIFVVLLLGIAAFLFYRDVRHEREIVNEIKELEKH